MVLNFEGERPNWKYEGSSLPWKNELILAHTKGGIPLQGFTDPAPQPELIPGSVVCTGAAGRVAGALPNTGGLLLPENL